MILMNENQAQRHLPVLRQDLGALEQLAPKVASSHCNITNKMLSKGTWGGGCFRGGRWKRLGGRIGALAGLRSFWKLSPMAAVELGPVSLGVQGMVHCPAQSCQTLLLSLEGLGWH